MSEHLVARLAAFTALLLGGALIAVLLLARGGSYELHLRFQTAGQLVRGNEVQVAGIAIGSVRDVTLTRDGQADVTVRIDDGAYRPLRRGTQAVVRQASLAGVANRFIDLRLPPGSPPAIPDGGVVPASQTVTAVELDQLFNTLDGPTRASLRGFLRGSARMWKGAGRRANAGMLYLDPALAAQASLFGELSRDDRDLQRLLISGADLASDVSARRDDLGALVDRLDATFTALVPDKDALASSLRELPGFLGSARATFARLRGALDTIEPTVADAAPLARSLPAFADELGGLSTNARPAVSRTAALVRSDGAANDLTDLLARLPAARNATTREVTADGVRRAALVDSASAALRGFAPELGFLAPYSVDAVGWFDDFGLSGVFDALGGSGRIATHAPAYASVGGQLTYVPPELRSAVANRVLARDQRNRCPGAMERGTAWKPSPDFNCDLSQVPPGR